MSNRRFLFSLFFLLLAPTSAHASVLLTEIMYDVSGTDTGREWVEITNTGSSSIDISAFKFFEANTNHTLSVVQGGGVLAAGASAIIADDEEKFLLDWPTFSGHLLGSSFSLSQSGETLILKDSALSVLDSVSYDPAAGAGGDGKSLQRAGSVFSAAVPTPGSYGSSNASNTADAAATTSPVAAQPEPIAGASPSPITVRISSEVRSVAGGGSYFSASAYGTLGVPLQGARFIWNFGDGTTAEGSPVLHSFAYPGRYVVTVSAGYSYSSGLDRMVVEAAAASVLLEAIGDGSLLIRNKGPQEMNIGLWSLADGDKKYVIPDGTIILAGEGVRFAAAITGLAGSRDAALLYPNGAPAADALVSKGSPLRGERVVGEPLRAAPRFSSGTTPTQTVIPSASEVTEAASGKNLAAGSALSGATGSRTSLLFSLAALAGLLGCGVAGVRYLQPSQRKEETLPTADEFEIEEA